MKNKEPGPSLKDSENRTFIMGILNITPDSFSGDGLAVTNDGIVDLSVLRAQEMISAGADILDIGGESTRPGAVAISEEEEISRVAPVVEAIAKRFNILISIDTYKSNVAATALGLGASIVNDVWAMEADPEMAAVVASHKASVVLMHNSSDRKRLLCDPKVGGSYLEQQTKDIVMTVREYLLERSTYAIKHGIPKENIIIDPGFGFGKGFAQNIEMLSRFKEFSELGFKLLSGPSRKSFTGHTLNLAPNERLEGTLAAVTISIEGGANIVRVHDVKEAKRAASFADSVVKARKN